MSWLGRLLRPKGGSEALTLLKLRVTRFRQLLRSYGSLLALLEDAAEKQGGGFILDRQYVITLAEQVAELADAVAFDLNVMTSQGNLPFYEQSERLRGELRSLVAEGGAGAPVRPGEAAAPTVSPAALAAALARFPVLYRKADKWPAGARRPDLCAISRRARSSAPWRPAACWWPSISPPRMAFWRPSGGSEPSSSTGGASPVPLPASPGSCAFPPSWVLETPLCAWRAAPR